MGKGVKVQIFNNLKSTPQFEMLGSVKSILKNLTCIQQG